MSYAIDHEARLERMMRVRVKDEDLWDAICLHRNLQDLEAHAQYDESTGVLWGLEAEQVARFRHMIDDGKLCEPLQRAFNNYMEALDATDSDE